MTNWGRRPRIAARGDRVWVGHEEENVVQAKSHAFAARIVRLYQHLATEKKEFVLSKQVLRCGTRHRQFLIRHS
jgi:hypothetical protein